MPHSFQSIESNITTKKEGEIMLNSIYEWLSGNALAIIISGIVSLIISKYFFDKANRESVLMTIIFPIVKILDSRYYTKSNYEALF